MDRRVLEASSRCVRLEWESVSIGRKLDEFLNNVPANWNDHQFGLYAIEGKHNAHPYGTVLYIGMTVAAGSSRSLQSVESRLFRLESPRTMYGSYWDLTLRWAPLVPAELFPDDLDRVNKTKAITRALENLLIVSMKPPLNSQGVDGWLDKDAQDLVVGNAGDKGLLLPMLHGHSCFFTHHTGGNNASEDSGE